MKQLIIKCMALLLLAAPILLLWSTASATSLIDNAKSPFIDETDTGAATDVAVIGTDNQQKDAFINVVRWVVNWVLWIMGLIALIFLIYGWFLMVTSAWDEEKYKKWITILRHAVIWLILIGTARFIASLVFWLINRTGNITAGSWAWTEG